MRTQIVAWFPLPNAFSDESHRRGTIPALENSQLDGSSFGVGSHDAVRPRLCHSFLLVVLFHFRRALIGERTPHPNTRDMSKNDQRAGSPAGHRVTATMIDGGGEVIEILGRRT